MNAPTFEFTMNARILKSEGAAQANPQAMKIAGELHEEELKKARLASGDLGSAKEAVQLLIDTWEKVIGDVPPEAEDVPVSAAGVKRMKEAIEMARTLTR